jgi:hypothetical protein
MRIEFMCYARDNIISMAKRDGFNMNPDQEKCLTDLINGFSNEQYEAVDNKMTAAIEDLLLMCGFPLNNAIRYSWKWSD